MLWLLVLILVLLVVLGYLMFAPVVLEVDSEKGVCRARFHHLASAAIHLSESSLIADLAVAGWKKEIDLLRSRKKEGEKTLRPKKTQRRKRHKPRMTFNKGRALLRTFRIPVCEVVADTGDMPLNGMLYPVFYGMSVWSGKSFRINFNGENEIKLKIHNNMARLLWAYLTH